jgi:xanthine/CO dehydrogenase XdhC/CoxF family maturation factor
MVGAISGGCLEGDALKKALLALEQRQNKLVTYDTSDEDDAVIGAQLGCNGVIQVLFEPIHKDLDNNPMELIRKVIKINEPSIIVTLFNLRKSEQQKGTLFIIDRQLDIAGETKELDYIEVIKANAKVAFTKNTSLFKEYHVSGQTHYSFIELCLPSPTLVLVGAGNDAQVLAQLATLSGWNVIVTDGRSTHASKNRFHSSCQVFVSEPERILDNIRIDHRTAFVLMTHNYQYDLSVLKLLLNESDIGYIGILGPKKKYQRMLDELEQKGIQLTEEQASKIYAPVGLDLGAETPAEIAISVISEILLVLNNVNPGHLRDRSSPIHNKSNLKFEVENV